MGVAVKTSKGKRNLEKVFASKPDQYLEVENFEKLKTIVDDLAAKLCSNPITPCDAKSEQK